MQKLPTIIIKAIKRGMLQIKDTVHGNSTFLTYGELCDKFCTPVAFIIYYGIIQAIPQLWKTILSHSTNNTQPYVNNYKCLEMSMSIQAKVYNHLNNNLNIILRYCQKWEKHLNIEIMIDQFEKCLNNVYLVTNYVKLHSFQYRLLVLAHVTDQQLQKWKIKPTNACFFAKPR